MKHLVSSMILATIIALPTIMASTSARLFQASSPSNIYVSPASKVVQIGQEFTIDVDVDYVSNSYGYEIWMNFDNNKLNASAIDYEGFLNNPTSIWYQEANNTGGYVCLAVTSLRPASAKTGGSPPPLATIHFTAIDLGSSTLHLDIDKTGLGDSQGIPILCTTTDGELICSAGPGVIDIAVTNLTSPKSVICQGYTGDVTARVENHGDATATFNVTVYANYTVAGNMMPIASFLNMVLDSGMNVNLTSRWNTTGFAKGFNTTAHYMLIACATPVLGETNTGDNNFTGGLVMVSMVGDVTGPSGWPDGQVEGRDITVIARLYATFPDSPNWNPNYDINNDGQIEGRDITLAALQYGKHDP